MRKAILVLLALASLAGAQVIGDTLTLQAPLPSGAQRISATSVGTQGNTNLYYMVATRYPQGLVLSQPVLAANTVGIANLNGVNYVQIGWTAAPNATGYYVIRGATQTFLSSGTCTSCVVVANTAATTFSDQGGATVNYPPAGVPTASAATFNQILDNTMYSEPTLRTLINGADIAFPVEQGLHAVDGAEWLSDEEQYRWRTESDIFIGDTSSGYVDWSARTGSIQGFGARITTDFTGQTYLKGGDFRVTNTAGGAGTGLIGSQTVATVAVGNVGEVYGGNFNAVHNAGSSFNAFGAVGNLEFGAASTGASIFNAGLYGSYADNSTAGISVPATNVTTGVIGIVNSTVSTTRRNDSAVMAYLASGNPLGAFVVRDKQTDPGANFEYGLDMYFNSAPFSNVFNVADIRGQQQGTMSNATAGIWLFNTAIGNGSLAFAALLAQANGTQVYCTDCDPTAGAVAACTSAGAQTGAMAFKIAGNWDCFSQ